MSDGATRDPGADALLALLRTRQAESWQRGEPAQVEQLLAQAPPGVLDGEAELELILAEDALRRTSGDPCDHAAWLVRFPRHAERLQRLLALQSLIGHAPTTQANETRVGELNESSHAETPNPDSAVTISQSASTGATQPASGRQVGPYQILSEVARGGMGVVFRAWQSGANRIVALKMTLAGQFADSEDRRRFLAEAEAAGQLDHPHIVPLYDVGEHEGQPYFSMALVEGQSLKSMLAEGPLLSRRAAELLIPIAEAVHYAHVRGIVHRDLKPANVLIDANGQPRVTDFGLAKRLSAESSLTASRQILGTACYMPPEQAMGRHEKIGPSADVYSLGALLYALLTGRPPFQAATVVETLLQVTGQEPVPPRRLNRNIAPDLETICLKCLRKEPTRRYASAAALADDLKRWTQNRPILARRVGIRERAWLWCRRRPAVAGLLLAMVVVVALGSWAASVRLRNSRVDGLIAELQHAETSEVPRIVAALARDRGRATPRLRALHAASTPGSRERLHFALALLPEDKSRIDELRNQLLTATPLQLRVVCDELERWTERVAPELWGVAMEESRPADERFRAACALARFDRADPRWEGLSEFVARHLVTREASEYLAWRDILKPARQPLLGPLEKIHADGREGGPSPVHRQFATEAIADYFSSDPFHLWRCLLSSEGFQFPILLARLKPFREIAVQMADRALRERLDDRPVDAREAFGRRQANAAVGALHFGAPERVWPLLRHSSDPRVRSRLIHLAAPLKVSPNVLVDRLDRESDVTARRALVLALGEYPDSQLSPEQRAPFIPHFLTMFETVPDAGMHSALEWLLRRWGQEDVLRTTKERLRQRDAASQTGASVDRNWLINSQGQTMAVIDAGEFVMGSPESEAGRRSDETPHRCRIDRRIAVSTCEVTGRQLDAFYDSLGLFDRFLFEESLTRARNESAPATWTQWTVAAWYCNWLSEQEGIPREEWCYEPNAKGEFGQGMAARNNGLDLSGYRLPTEAEWEFCCRAGASTSRFYGESDDLLAHYAWHRPAGDDVPRPVGLLKPNDFGLFDMLGNAVELCDFSFLQYPNGWSGRVYSDRGSVSPITATSQRVVRGGASFSKADELRSSYRSMISPLARLRGIGFRPVRTLPPTSHGERPAVAELPHSLEIAARKSSALVAINERRWEDALAQLDIVVSLEPGNNELCYLLAVREGVMRRFDRAAADYAMIIQNRDSTFDRCERTALFLLNREPTRARAVFDELARMRDVFGRAGPRDDRRLQNSYLIARTASFFPTLPSDSVQLLSSIRSAMNEAPGDPWYGHTLGMVLLRSGRPEDALREFRNTERSHTKWHPSLNRLGEALALLHQGRSDESRRAAETILSATEWAANSPSGKPDDGSEWGMTDLFSLHLLRREVETAMGQ